MFDQKNFATPNAAGWAATAETAKGRVWARLAFVATAGGASSTILELRKLANKAEKVEKAKKATQVSCFTEIERIWIIALHPSHYAERHQKGEADEVEEELDPKK